MQLLVRCGGPAGTLAVDCSQEDCVGTLKQLLHSKSRHVGPPHTQLLLHAGRCLQDDDRQLCNYGLSAGSVLQLSARLLGGGGDGGSTGAESRSCYLEMYLDRKPDKVNPAEEQLAKFTQCHLSGQPLQPPCVVDELGNLFNKDALLQALLNKTLPPSLSYISGLKSVVELKLAPNPYKCTAAPKAAGRGSHQPANNETEFCCPVTGVQFNGRFRFLVHRRSGHVLAEKAVKEVPAVVEELVGGPWGPEDWILVNPAGEQLEEMRVKLAAKLAAERAEKEKKARKKAAKGAAASGSTLGATGAEQQQGDQNGDGAGPSSNGASTSTAAVAAGNGHMESGKKRSPPQPSHTGGLPAPAAAAAASASRQQQGAPQPGSTQPPAKKPKKLVGMPAHATPSLYASLFTSSQPEGKETYCCRSVSARGVHLA